MVLAARDGRLATCGGGDLTVKVWDAASATLRPDSDGSTAAAATLPHGADVYSLTRTVLRDGRLASGDEAGVIRLCTWVVGPGTTGGACVAALRGGPPKQLVYGLACLPDGRLGLASCTGDYVVRVWSVDAAAATYVRIPRVAPAGDGGGGDGADSDADGATCGTVTLPPRPPQHAQLAGRARPAWPAGLVLLPDGRLACGDDDGGITVWR